MTEPGIFSRHSLIHFCPLYTFLALLSGVCAYTWVHIYTHLCVHSNFFLFYKHVFLPQSLFLTHMLNKMPVLVSVIIQAYVVPYDPLGRKWGELFMYICKETFKTRKSKNSHYQKTWNISGVVKYNYHKNIKNTYYSVTMHYIDFYIVSKKYAICNKCCSFDLSIHQKNLEKSSMTYIKILSFQHW